jgi:hypothetical protein
VRLGEGIGALARRERSVAKVGVRTWSMFWMFLAFSFVGYLGFFLVLHLRGVGWAPGQVLEDQPGYWAWIYRTVWSEDLVTASRSSDLAAHFPLWLLLAYVPISIGYLGSLAALRALPQNMQPRLRTLLGAAVVFSIPLLLLPNLLSTDVYSYISFGRIAAVWNGNPFIDRPDKYASDEYLQWVYWSDVPSVYGPPWIYLSMLVTGLVERTWSSPVTYVLAYKIVACLLHLLNGALLWAILSKWQPEQRSWRTAFYLLNPLPLVEFSGNAHNDVLMITFILLGIWFHLHTLWSWTVVAWTLAVLAKWIALPLLPLYGLVILWTSNGLRMRAMRLAGMAGIVAVVAMMLYLPFWRGPETLKVLIDAPPQRLMVNSLGDMAAFQIQYATFLLGRGPHPEQAKWASMSLAISQPSLRERDLDGTQLQDWRSDQRVLLQRYNRQVQLQQGIIIRQERTLSRILRYIGLGLVMLTCLAGAAITRNLRTLLLALAWIFFVYVAIGSVWVWPWYATWFVALAAMLDWRATGRTALVLSLLVPVIYPLTPILPLPTLLEQFRAVLAFGPALVFATYQLSYIMHERWAQRRLRRGIGD